MNSAAAPSKKTPETPPMSSVQFHFAQTEESPGYLLWQVSMLWQRKMKRGLDEIGLTHTQFVLLASLGWLSRAVPSRR